MQILTWLRGKRTYGVALLTALDGLYQFYVQHGSSRQALVSYLLFGGGLAALRAAIAGLGK